MVIVSIIACAFTIIVHLTVKRSQRKIPKGENLCSVNKVYGIVIFIISVAAPEVSSVIYDYITLPPLASAAAITTEPNTAYATTSYRTKTITTEPNVAYSVIPSFTST